VGTILRVIKEFFNGVKPDMMFIDIDGVMTITRGSYILDLDVAKLLREVESLKLPICLTSGNAYPVVLTLQRYLGFSPLFIAENGCVIHINRNYIKLCRESLDPIVEEISKRFGLPKSDSNLYRFCDRAFRITGDLRSNISRVREIEKEIMNLYPNIYALYTGYVMHIYPRDCDKGRAMEIIAENLNIDLGRSIAIGDSVTDIPMLKKVGFGVAVGDADEELKSVAKLVLPFKASESTKIFLLELIEYLRSIG